MMRTTSEKMRLAPKSISVRKASFFQPLSLTLCWFALICLVSAVGLPASGFAQQAFKRHITVYGSSTLLARYPSDIANNYNLIITEYWNSASVANIKTINSAVKSIFYRDLAGMLTSYDDWSAASQNPTWFVTDAVTNKPIVRRTFGWYLMDITNPAFRQHLVQYIQQKLTAYPVFDGVFLDDVWASIAPGNFVIEGTTTPATFNPAYLQAYQGAVTTFLQALKTAIGSKLAVINSEPTTYVRNVDGVMLEGLFHGSTQAATSYEPAVSWLADMQTFANLLPLNKMILVESGSQGSGAALQNQFLFSFASFLLLCNQNTSFFFETPTWSTQLLPYPQYTQNFGPALASLPASSFAATVVQRPMSSSLTGWAAATTGITLVQANGAPALQFVSNGPKGAYMSRCIDLSGAATGALSISCSAEGSNVVPGKSSWMTFALLGKFCDANNNILQSGDDLLFGSGAYGWTPHSVSYQLPAGTRYYCVTALGFYPSSLGTGLVQNLQINSVVPATQWFESTFLQATVFVNPSNTTATTGIAKQPALAPQTAVIVSN